MLLSQPVAVPLRVKTCSLSTLTVLSAFSIGIAKGHFHHYMFTLDGPSHSLTIAVILLLLQVVNRLTSCHRLLCFYWLTHPSGTLFHPRMLLSFKLGKITNGVCHSSAYLPTFAFCSGVATMYDARSDFTHFSVNSALTSLFTSSIDVEGTVPLKRP